jgi:hypothetical protein
MSSEKSRYTCALQVFSEETTQIGDEHCSEKKWHAVCVITKIFALETLNQKGKKKCEERWAPSPFFTSFFEKTHVTQHTLFVLSLPKKCFLLLKLLLNPFAWTRLFPRETSPAGMKFFVFCVFLIDRPRVNFVLLYLLFSLHVIFSMKRMLSKRAREEDRHLHSSRHQTPLAVKASFVPSFPRKE